MAELTGDPSVGAAEELVEVIDDDGSVIRTVTRAQIRRENLLHRSVFIAVVTSADELIVHRRAHWKDVWPSYWDICFGGVVAAGETDEAAACRELAEEAGVIVDPHQLQDLGRGRFENGLVREVGRIYRVNFDGPFSFVDGEVSQVDRVELSTIGGWLGSHQVCPDSLALAGPHLSVMSDASSARPRP